MAGDFLLEVATCVTATCTLDNCTLTVPSGILMYVMADSQWSTSGAVGNLILSNGTINCNGYTLTYASMSGSGTINETARITETRKVDEVKSEAYTLDGRRTNASAKGIIIQDGKIFFKN